jgi:hypothetical protein
MKKHIKNLTLFLVLSLGAHAPLSAVQETQVPAKSSRWLWPAAYIFGVIACTGIAWWTLSWRNKKKSDQEKLNEQINKNKRNQRRQFKESNLPIRPIPIIGAYEYIKTQPLNYDQAMTKFHHNYEKLVWISKNFSSIHEDNVNNMANKDEGNTALHLASRGGCENMVATLIQKKADVNMQNVVCETPLHELARRGIDHYSVEKIAKLLINNKADINAQNSFSHSPLQVAEICKNNTMIQVLQQAGASVRPISRDEVKRPETPTLCTSTSLHTPSCNEQTLL